MNAEQLFTHFDRIADSPDAIPRLRRFILDLAVRGKLVPQDPNDEPASELLKRIAADKTQQKEIGYGKRNNHLVGKPKTPFFTPSNWEWAPLGKLARIQTGKLNANAAVKGGQFPFFTCSQKPSEIDSYSFDTAAVLLAGNGDFNLKSYKGKFDAYQRTYVIEPVSWNLGYCFINLRSQISRITDNQRGSAIPYLKLADISDLAIPLPPLAEQHRIVAKVDELMALCDRLEASRAKREAARDRMATASLAHLNVPDPDSATFQKHAAFALNNLTPLTTRPDQIKAFRQTILNLAVRGKLAPQNPNDEPASELLKRIAAEKDRLVKAGNIPPAKPTVKGLNENFERQLPLNWSKIAISQIAYLRSGIALKHGEEKSVGIPYLKVSDLSLPENDEGIITSSRFVGRDRKEAVIESGSIVFPKRGGAIATNRKRRSHVNIVCDSNIMAMKPFLNDLLPFLELWFSSLDLWKLNSGTAVPQINNKDIYPLAVLLPPLAEQHRIVAKVDELMALCDQLEASLAMGNNTSQRLLDTLLHEALGPAGNR